MEKKQLKVDVYGRPYDQGCQNAMSLFKAANVDVKFHNTDRDHNKRKLISVTKQLLTIGKDGVDAGYTYETLERSPVPIIISEDTKEILVGYETGMSLYNNILKEAGVIDIETFSKKHLQRPRRKFKRE